MAATSAAPAIAAAGESMLEAHTGLFQSAVGASEVDRDTDVLALQQLPPPPANARSLAVVAYLVQQREGCAPTLLTTVRNAIEAESVRHRADVAAEIQRRMDRRALDDLRNDRTARERELEATRSNTGFFGPRFSAPALPVVNEPFRVSAEARQRAGAAVFDPLARWRGTSVLAAQFTRGESVVMGRATTTLDDVDLSKELLFPYREEGRNSASTCLLPVFGHAADSNRVVVDDARAWRNSRLQALDGDHRAHEEAEGRDWEENEADWHDENGEWTGDDSDWEWVYEDANGNEVNADGSPLNTTSRGRSSGTLSTDGVGAASGLFSALASVASRVVDTLTGNGGANAVCSDDESASCSNTRRFATAQTVSTRASSAAAAAASAAAARSSNNDNSNSPSLSSSSADTNKHPFTPPLNSVQFGASFPAFFAYDGSLTTRPCNQTVSWLVGASPIAASAEDIKFFQSLVFGNARRVQRLNERVVRSASSALSNNGL